MNIEEVRKAAAEFSVSVKEFTERQMTSEELVNHYINERVLARWAVDELARRDAEAAERALPITEEWLRTLGDVIRDDEYALAVQMAFMTVVHAKNATKYATACKFADALDCPCAVEVKTRGQLLDLLAALKGGES